MKSTGAHRLLHTTGWSRSCSYAARCTFPASTSWSRSASLSAKRASTKQRIDSLRWSSGAGPRLWAGAVVPSRKARYSSSAAGSSSSACSKRSAMAVTALPTSKNTSRLPSARCRLAMRVAPPSMRRAEPTKNQRTARDAAQRFRTLSCSASTLALAMSRASPHRMPTPIVFEVHLAHRHQLADSDLVSRARSSDSSWYPSVISLLRVESSGMPWIALTSSAVIVPSLCCMSVRLSCRRRLRRPAARRWRGSPRR
jgi:hypothetical protein